MLEATVIQGLSFSDQFYNFGHGFILLGRFVSKDHPRPGQLYFSDPSGTIMCILLNSRLDVFATDICLLEFRVSKVGNDNCLQVSKWLGSDNLASNLHSYSISRDLLMENSYTRGFKTGGVFVSGCVMAKSALLVNSKTLFFSVTLRIHSMDLALFFRADSHDSFWICRIHEFLNVMESYDFSGLKVYALKLSAKENPTTGLLFIHGNSDLACSNRAPSDQNSFNQLEKRQRINTNQYTPPFSFGITNYTGTITRIINPATGLYEIDDSYVLFTTYFPLFYCGLEICVGQRIELFNVHVIDYTPTCKRYLLACPISSVKIHRFAKLNQPLILQDSGAKRAFLKKWRGLNFIDILNLQQIKDRLDIEDKDTIALGFLERLGYTPYYWTQYQGILDHSECRLAESRYEAFFCEAVSKIKILIDSTKSDCDSTSISVTCIDSHAIHEHRTVLVGRFTLSKIGTLEFKDNTSSIPVSIISGDDILDDLIYNVCMIEEFEVCQEKLINSTFECNSFTYLRLHISKIYRIKVDNVPRACISIADEFYFYPESIQPRQLDLSGANLCHAYIQGLLYPCNQEYFMEQCQYSLIIRFSQGGFELYNLFAEKLYKLKVASSRIKNVSQDSYIIDCNSENVLQIQVAENSQEDSAGIIQSLYNALKARSKKCMSISETLNFALAKLEYGKLQIVNVQGIIGSKSLASVRGSDSNRKDCAFAVKECNHIGFENYDCTFRLLDEHGNESLAVLHDKINIILPLGLTPGAMIQFKNLGISLERNGSVISRVMCVTNVRIVSKLQSFASPDEDVEIQMNMHIGDYAIDPIGFCKSVRLSIVCLTEVTIKPRCGSCAGLVIGTDCVNGCADYEIEVQGDASAIAEDGSCQVWINIPNIELIYTILKVNSGEKSKLKDIIDNGKSLSFKLNDARKLEIDPWILSKLKDGHWGRQIRVRGAFSRLPIDLFNSNSTSCLNSMVLYKPSSFRDLQGNVLPVAGIKPFRLRVEQIEEIHPIQEAHALFESLAIG